MGFARKMYLKAFVGEYLHIRFFGDFYEIKGDLGKRDKEILLVEFGQNPDELRKINPNLEIIFILSPTQEAPAESERVNFLKKNQDFQKKLKAIVQKFIALES
jgi:hypothetical protein